MQKIIIIGCPGSGKSTLSKQLSQILNLPLIHLDKEFWLPEWVKPDREEWNKKLVTLLERPQWIMDGNFNRSIELRLQYADTLIYLDFNKYICNYRIKKRIRENLGTVRDDMAEGCAEQKDKEFLKFAWNFNKLHRREYYEMLKKHPDKNIVILRSPRKVKKYLAQLSKS